jgi:hypothetical protein
VHPVMLLPLLLPGFLVTGIGCMLARTRSLALSSVSCVAPIPFWISIVRSL